MGDQKVDLIKKTYSKTEYSKVIDTKFSQLGVVSLNVQIENTVTVNQFFESYNNLPISVLLPSSTLPAVVKRNS